MLFNKSLEIAETYYQPTKDVLIKNGGRVSEQSYGSRKILYSNSQICGYSEMDFYLPMSGNLKNKMFYQFLSAFKRSLYNQIRKNDSLLDLKIDFTGLSRDKNYSVWEKVQNKTIYYNVDLSSAYWQIAFRLGYISKKVFNSYIEKDEYKEAKRYAVSFLARENEMEYFDGREINQVSCDISSLYQIYDNIRNELYKCIQEVKDLTPNWIEYNIDGIFVLEKDLTKICEKFNQMNLKYKINECVKVDESEYVFKNQFRKF
jgi:hypothetical protein